MKLCDAKGCEQELVYGDTEKSMNKYFSTIGEELAKVSQGNNSKPQGTGEIENIKQMKTINFVGRLFKEAIEKLKPGRAHGHDEITTREMKFIRKELVLGSL